MDKKINIIMFCPQFRPVIGGSERQAEKLATALVAAGHCVTLLTPRLDPDSPNQEEVNGVNIERFPLNDLSRFYPIPGIALLNVPYLLWQIVQAIRPRLIDVQVLHCHIASLQTAGAALAGRISGVPVLCKAAVADERSDLGELEKGGPSGRFVAWLIRLLVEIWVAPTKAVEEALTRARVDSRTIVHIPNGVEIPEVCVIRSQRKSIKRFLYLGRLSANTQRDIPTLIKAFDRLASSRSDIELAVVGDGDLYNETKSLAKACINSGRIQLPGFDQPEKWFAWADCFVLPSRREGLSNALLEAMAVGLPCIANDIPPNREVLANGEAGVLVPVENSNALVEAMQMMVEKDGFAIHYANVAKERVLQFYSIRTIAANYINLYESVYSQKQS